VKATGAHRWFRPVACCAVHRLARRHGAPRTPDDLAKHNCLIGSEFTSWEYKSPDDTPGSVRVTGRYVCDHSEVLREWALAGLGIALQSTWDVRQHLERGALVPLLPGYSFDSDGAIYAVYPLRRHLPAKTRAFIDFLADSFGDEPFWDRIVVKPRIRVRWVASNSEPAS
jgi:DNA-binding transcriptional LysR family regulator